MMQSARMAVMVICLSWGLAAKAEDVDPDNDDSQYAWAGNLGWINAEPLGNGGPGMSLSEEAATGWLWSANSGWISLSCENTASCESVDYGVLNSGDGQLSGYAWSPNVGWISFSCADSNSCDSVDYGVQVDPSSGRISGWAWAANTGWISFSCSNSESCASVDYGVQLAGPSVGQDAMIEVLPTAIDFGEQPLASTSDAEVVVVDSVGLTDLLITSISISGPESDDFSVVAGTDLCSGQAIPVGDFCGFELEFSPLEPGIREARAVIVSNAPDSPTEVALTGTNDVLFADDFEVP